MNKRNLLSTSAAVGAVTIVPRSVLGKGMIPPSDKITMLNVGCGYQGHNDLATLIRSPQIEIVGVADPNKYSLDYLQWAPNDQRNRVRTISGETDWLDGATAGVPGGRDVMKYAVETYYKKNRPDFSGSIRAGEDYREMLESMPDIDAVKIVTPDHLHSYIAVDCFRRGKHIISQKPLGNKMREAMTVVDLADRQRNIATYIMAYGSSGNNGINTVKAWIDAGAIGKLREIHNWSGRPYWPQFSDIPTEKPPIPRGFNWDLWLGPSQYRDYSPKYTHCCFRGWFEFGAGSISDMGIYSMIPVFDVLQLGSAVAASSRFSRVYNIDLDQVPRQVVNTWSYPLAGGFRFEIPFKNGSGNIFFTWSDGGMKPDVPYGYPSDDLRPEGMMFIGEKGAIVGGFYGDKPILCGVSEADKKRYEAITAPPYSNPSEIVSEGTPRWLQDWINDCKGTSTSKNRGSFNFVRELTESYNLGAVSMMCDGKKLTYDSRTRTITNDAQANGYLSRDTRRGWEFI